MRDLVSVMGISRLAISTQVRTTIPVHRQRVLIALTIKLLLCILKLTTYSSLRGHNTLVVDATSVAILVLVAAVVLASLLLLAIYNLCSW